MKNVKIAVTDGENVNVTEGNFIFAFIVQDVGADEQRTAVLVNGSTNLVDFAEKAGTSIATAICKMADGNKAMALETATHLVCELNADVLMKMTKEEDHDEC